MTGGAPGSGCFGKGDTCLAAKAEGAKVEKGEKQRCFGFHVALLVLFGTSVPI
jgi:hypothetical protein